MFLLSFARVIKFSFQDIGRNIWLSIVTMSILILALFSVNMLLTVNVISQAAIGAVKEKIDVNIYIKPDTEESKIMALKAQISGLSQVKDVQYISKAQALESFKEKHQNNPEVMESLKEIGKNPLTPSLVIKPKDVDQYQELIVNLNSIEDDIIESRNFDDHKLMIDKINGITDRVSEAGMVISFTFIIITLLLVYNSIRVAIYTHRREIKIMRLVGASNWFIRAPYLFSSIIYTVVGVSAIVVIYYFFLNLLQPYIETFFIDYDINLAAHFRDNFINIFGLQFLVGIVVNMGASLIAVSKYSKV
ncbi:ABC transporter permease [Candidatus Parcubacteria bacterium]|nr:ABC transporter permease [Patescibacteria group bacterium]MBU4347510.1 ABC transporter permease [Patescibacteria group bacterium]MCG2690793.1 ABC transporter permease [Candidatus Parcubacteria bacterium]